MKRCIHMKSLYFNNHVCRDVADTAIYFLPHV